MSRSVRVDRKSGRAPQRFVRHVEEEAINLRQQAGLGYYGKLNPWDHVESFGIVIAGPHDLTGLSAEDRESLGSLDARVWSGGGQELPDGRLQILLNPNQSIERAAVTIMEEVAHRHFGHQPSLINTNPLAMIGRRYDEDSENEAYWTAAATLLPSVVVANAVWKQQSAHGLAADHGVSIELVEFRIKTLRLWPWYRAYRVAA